ncbi:hypothetical protein, partial [Piscirickettsia salmonis]
RGFIVVAFCSAILHHWMCKIPTEVATLTFKGLYWSYYLSNCNIRPSPWARGYIHLHFNLLF